MKIKNEIVSFFHCMNCSAEKPEHLPPREWQFIEVGGTPQGIQVWCKRCDMNIVHLTTTLWAIGEEEQDGEVTKEPR